LGQRRPPPRPSPAGSDFRRCGCRRPCRLIRDRDGLRPAPADRRRPGHRRQRDQPAGRLAGSGLGPARDASNTARSERSGRQRSWWRPRWPGWLLNRVGSCSCPSCWRLAMRRRAYSADFCRRQQRPPSPRTPSLGSGCSAASPFAWRLAAPRSSKARMPRITASPPCSGALMASATPSSGC
jgi:hypothetical protein